MARQCAPKQGRLKEAVQSFALAQRLAAVADPLTQVLVAATVFVFGAACGELSGASVPASAETTRNGARSSPRPIVSSPRLGRRDLRHESGASSKP